MEDKNSLVNTGTKHSSGVDVLSPQAPEQGLAERELDAAIAVQVMGYIPVWGDFWRGAVCPGKWNCAVSRADAWAFPYNGHGVRAPDGKFYCTQEVYAWNPSTDIANAMKVVEKMREQGYGAVMADNMGGTPWSVDFVGTADVHEGDADTLPEAICRAALATVNAPAQEMGTTTSR